MCLRVRGLVSVFDFEPPGGKYEMFEGLELVIGWEMGVRLWKGSLWNEDD